MSMHTFEVPVAKLRETVTIEVDDEGLRDMAAHGAKQRINDVTAALKRADYATADEFESAVRTAVTKVVDRINSGDFGTRGPRDPKKAEARRAAQAIMDAGLTAEDIMAAIEAAKAAKLAA